MVNSTHKTLRIVTKEFSDFDILKNDIKLFSHYFIDIHTLGDNDIDSKWSSLKDFISFLQKNNIIVFINGLQPDKVNQVNDCSILEHYKDIQKYNEDLDFIDVSSNSISIMFWPMDYSEVAFCLEKIETLGKKYGRFSFLLYLGEMQEKISDIINEVENIPYHVQERLHLIGVGKCYIKDSDVFSLSTPSNFLNMNLYESYPGRFRSLRNERLSTLKKSIRCKECARSSSCFGIPKISSLSEISPTNKPLSKEYEIQADFFYRMYHYIDENTLHFDPYNPNDKANLCVKSMQRRRLYKNFNGANFYSIWTSSSSFYFNRPLETENIPLWGMSDKGLPSLNIEYIGKGIPELEFKTVNDQLVPEHGFSIISKIRFFDNWTEQDRKRIESFTFDTIKSIIIENGGDANLITQVEQDIFYNGKKFAGKEWKFDLNNGYLENTIVFCSYLAEKKWVDKRNNNSVRKSLTGITDELPKVTKELLVSEIDKRAKDFFGKLNDKVYLK